MPERRDDTGLEGVFAALRRRWPILLLCLILVPAAALAASLSQVEQYEARAKILFSAAGPEQRVLGTSAGPSAEDRKRNVATLTQLVSLRPVAQRTADRLPGPQDVDVLLDRISVGADETSDLATITVKASDPAAAAQIANTFAEEYIESRREAGRTSVREALEVVRREQRELLRRGGPVERIRELRERIQDLEISSALQTGNAELVERARPPERPVSPKPVRDTLLGALLGAFLAVGIALLVDRLDRRLPDAAAIESALGLPVLGVVPRSRRELRSGGWLTSGKVAEAFRLLRVNLRYLNVHSPVRSVLVDSPGPGEGKTTVAHQLALTAAGAGASVLLLEADFRKPALEELLHVSQEAGLPEAFAGFTDFEDVVVTVPLDPADIELGTIDVVTAGQHLPPNPGDLLESPRAVDLLRAAEDRYELVVIDAPSTTVVSDAIPLLRVVSGVLVVARVGSTTREAASALRSQLEQLEARVLGAVINDADDASLAYEYAARAKRERPWRIRRRRRRAAAAPATMAVGSERSEAPGAGVTEG